MARHRRLPRFYREAQLQALVRFGPELEGLLELQRQARKNYRGSVRSARSTTRGIIAETRRAEPEVRDVYSDAARTQGVQNAAVASHLSELGPVSDSISAAASSEAAASQSRLAESQASSLNELAQRRVSAREGRHFAVQQARSQFVEDIGEVLRRKRSLGREEGAFVAATAGDLRQDARDRRLRLQIEREGNRASDRNNRRSARQSERNSQRSAGIDPATGKPIPGGKLDPKVNGGKGRGEPLTPLQMNKAGETIDEALSWAKRFAAKGARYNDAKTQLANGTDAVEGKPLHDPVTGKPLYNKDGTPKTSKSIPGIPKFDSDLLLEAALDIAYFGHLRRATQQKMRRRGLRPGRMGLSLYKPRKYVPPGPVSEKG